MQGFEAKGFRTAADIPCPSAVIRWFLSREILLGSKPI